MAPKILDRGIPREKYRVMSPPDYLLVFPQNQTSRARKILWLAAVRSLEELHDELSLSMSSGFLFCSLYLYSK